MAAAEPKVTKTRQLTESEDFTSYQLWKNQTIHFLTHGENKKYKQYFKDCDWKSVHDDPVLRGLAATADQTAAGRKEELDDLLDQLVRYAPHLIADKIKEDSTSMESIWAMIREYYHFQASEMNFLRLMDMRLEPGERPAHFFYRMMAHVRDNLLKPGGLHHNGKCVDKKEELSPTVERLVVALWMDRLDPGLISEVSKNFSFDLTQMSCKDIQPRVMLALPTMLAQLQGDASVNASFSTNTNRRGPRSFAQQPFTTRPPFPQQGPSTQTRSQPNQQVQTGASQCQLCLASKRPSAHLMGDCRFIPLRTKISMFRSALNASARGVTADESDELEIPFDELTLHADTANQE